MTSEVEISEQQYPDDKIPEIPQMYNDSSEVCSKETQQDITDEKNPESPEDVPMCAAQEISDKQHHSSFGKNEEVKSSLAKNTSNAKNKTKTSSDAEYTSDVKKDTKTSPDAEDTSDVKNKMKTSSDAEDTSDVKKDTCKDIT